MTVCVYESMHVCVGLRARHPVMVGLKNCLHVAARNDVHHITVPLLLVHSMEPVSLRDSPNIERDSPALLGIVRTSRSSKVWDLYFCCVQEMTIPWCLKRAELVFKCVKGKS